MFFFLERAPAVPRRNVAEFFVGCASPRHECSEVAAGRGERLRFRARSPAVTVHPSFLERPKVAEELEEQVGGYTPFEPSKVVGGSKEVTGGRARCKAGCGAVRVSLILACLGLRPRRPPVWAAGVWARRRVAFIPVPRSGPAPSRSMAHGRVIGSGGMGALVVCRNRGSGAPLLVASLRLF